MRSLHTYTILLSLAASFASAQNVSTTEELISAVRDGAEGRKIQIGPGIFELPGPLELKTGMTLQGTGMGETVITHTADWKPSTEALPKGEIRPDEANSQAYLIRMRDKAVDITISNLTLRGPQLHGAIFGISNKRVGLHHFRIEDVLYSGIRCYFMKGSRIHDCEFIGAGGKWKRGGIPGVDGGVSGGASIAPPSHPASLSGWG